MTSTILQLSDLGQRVALRQKGTGSPILLIHGVGMQSAAWSPQIDALSRSYRVIAVDMPGHGGSAPLPGGSRLPDFVHWCHEVVQSLDLGPVSIAGHSMGALIAMGFAVEHPRLTSRVALLNGVFRRTPKARSAVIARATDIRAGQIDKETPLRRWFPGDAGNAKARQDVAAWLADVTPEHYATAYTAFAHGDTVYADRVHDISCPLLALTGDGDPNSTPQMAKDMASAAQNGQAVVIKGHHHMVNLTAPDLVSDHLIKWLRTQAPEEVLQ